MSTKSPAKAPSSIVFGSDAAPIIYFDGVAAYGHRDGVAQLEVAANHLVPVSLGSTEVKTKVVMTAHLRCSAGTLMALREIIDKMMAPEMTKQ